MKLYLLLKSIKFVFLQSEAKRIVYGQYSYAFINFTHRTPSSAEVNQWSMAATMAWQC